jgi:hypothetical protein
MKKKNSNPGNNKGRKQGGPLKSQHERENPDKIDPTWREPGQPDPTEPKPGKNDPTRINPDWNDPDKVDPTAPQNSSNKQQEDQTGNRPGNKGYGDTSAG